MSDLENLLAMGFEQAKAELALKNSGNCMAHPHLLIWTESTD